PVRPGHNDTASRHRQCETASRYCQYDTASTLPRRPTMFSSVAPQITDELGQIREQGLFKNERVIVSPQRASIVVAGGARVLNLCANNYLGLADDPRIIEAAKDTLDRWGFGMASVRFICGTQDLHKQLEHRISDFLGTADTILYSSCFDANGGL